ncbi:MAG: hypothetical protein ACK6DK_09800 [Gemmatimonadota bacterium]|jgi:hypothetical protein|nr:hypothetical protein [Gemmatimonadota bacterium]
MTQTMEMLRERVRAARIDAAVAGGRVQQVQEDLKATHADLFVARERAEDALAEAEQALRAAAEAHYRETGEKKPCEGVAIRETVMIEYLEPEAIEWAKTAMPQLVSEKLDAKAFEKIAKAAPLPFVITKTVGKATIASELPAPAVVAPVVSEEAPF